MSQPPLVIFAYRRPDALRQVLHRLERCWGIGSRDLYIFCDGTDSDDADELALINSVRQLAADFRWPGEKHLIEQQHNLGLANSVIAGVNQVLETHLSVVVIEDDILVSRSFLKFIDKALDTYKLDQRVAGVSGYSYGNIKGFGGNYFLPIGCSWSWATWRREWQQVEWRSEVLLDEFERTGKGEDFRCGNLDYFAMLNAQYRGECDSWAIRYLASFWLNERLFLYPKHALAVNIGFGESATHTRSRTPLHASKFHLRWSARMPAVEVKPEHIKRMCALFSET